VGDGGGRSGRELGAGGGGKRPEDGGGALGRVSSS